MKRLSLSLALAAVALLASPAFAAPRGFMPTASNPVTFKTDQSGDNTVTETYINQVYPNRDGGCTINAQEKITHTTHAVGGDVTRVEYRNVFWDLNGPCPA